MNIFETSQNFIWVVSLGDGTKILYQTIWFSDPMGHRRRKKSKNLVRDIETS